MSSRVLVLIPLAILLCGAAAFAQITEPDMESQIASLRADLRADKIAIITEAMRFTEAEAKAFWPVYRQYESELVTLNDQRVAIIKNYSDKYASITDADAKLMMNQALDFESRRTDLKRKYVTLFEKAGLRPLMVARYFQLEHRLDLLVDLKLAASLPALLVNPGK